MPNPGAVLLPNQQAPYEGVWSTYQSVNVPPNGELGIVCVCAAGSHGPLNTFTFLNSVPAAQALFGQTSNIANMVRQVMQAGAIGCQVIQPGTSGTAPTLTLVDTTSESPINVVTVTALWPTADTIAVTVRPNPGNAAQNQLLVYCQGILVETWAFTSGAAQPLALVNAVSPTYSTDGTSNSQYIGLTWLAAGDGTLADVTQTALTGGVAPTQDTGAYTTALGLIEQVSWRALVVDTTSTSVFATIAAEMDTIFADGYRRFAVCGEASTQPLATAMDATYAGSGTDTNLNDPLVLYTVGGFQSSAGWPLGTVPQTIDGFLFAARVAGLVSLMQPGDALTAASLPDASAVLVSNTGVGSWTGAQLSQIELGGGICARWRNGKIVLSMGMSTWQVQTQVPFWAQGLDWAWSKVQPTSNLFYLLDAIDGKWEQILTNPDTSQRPPNDKFGQGVLIAAAQQIVNQAIAQNQVQPGATVVLDAGKTALAVAAGSYDTAVFDVVNFDMIDGLEVAVLQVQMGLNNG